MNCVSCGAGGTRHRETCQLSSRIVELFKRGDTPTEIATRFSISRGAVVNRLNREGVQTKDPHRGKHNKKLAKLIQQIKSGKVVAIFPSDMSRSAPKGDK